MQVLVPSPASVSPISGNNRHLAGVPSLRLNLFLSPTRPSPFYRSTSTTQHYIPAQILVPAIPLLTFLQDEVAFSRTHTWALLGSRKEHWLLIATSTRDAGAARRAVSGAFFLQTEYPIGTVQWTSTAWGNYIQQPPSFCLMQQPPCCSEAFLNDASPWMLCHRRTHREKGRSVKNSRRLEK